ncbi:MAG: hypothetical protein FWC61_03735 [Proteobacteria bacterium]|nr:hypothetical protein [Pseudomonadota bacterium]
MRCACAIRSAPVKSWVLSIRTLVRRGECQFARCRGAWKRAQGREHTTIVGADNIRPNKGRMQYAPTKRRTFRVMAGIAFAGMMLLCAFPGAPTIIGFANAGSAYAGPAANVDFVHRYITQKWGITVPIKTSNIYQAVNVKYTLCAVDRANEILNGAPSATTYCNHPLATTQIIDDSSVRNAVDRLVVKDLYPGTGGEGEPFKLYMTGMTANSQFGFYISASGNFTVDWGDGTAVQNIVRPNASLNDIYTHTYSAAGNYIVTIGGRATGYIASTTNGAIQFPTHTNPPVNPTKITKISGDLGSVFPILTSPVAGQFHSPNFIMTFNNFTGWTGPIPANLFAGLHGAPVDWMFNNTFGTNSNLKGSIPAQLFAGISGAPAQYMFSQTFYNCTGLTGSVPAGLFSGISGAPAQYMFSNTFYGCTGLTGSVPAGLFGTFTGAPATGMFYNTFGGCTGLTGIANGIWDLSGVSNASASMMFTQTFYNCSNITSPSPSIAPGSTTKLWTQFSAFTGGMTFYGATKLADYASIPTGWK